MSAESNVRMITKLFGVFSCGGVESILAALTDDVDWQGPGATTLGACRGAGAAEAVSSWPSTSASLQPPPDGTDGGCNFHGSRSRRGG